MNLGLFGLGSSRSRSSSQSQSSGFSVSRSTDSVFGADIFAELFGGANAAAQAVNPDALTGTANRLFDSGMGFLDELGALGGAGPMGAGEEYLAGELGGGDELLSQEIDALQAELGEFFNETVMPGIRGDAIAAGALGGGRQGVAEGIAGRDLLRSFERGALGLRQNAATRRASMAQQLASLQIQRRLGAAGSGLAALPAQYQLAEAGSMAALSPYMALSEILGGPAILSDSLAYGSEQSSSSSSSSSRAYQLNLGSA